MSEFILNTKIFIIVGGWEVNSQMGEELEGVGKDDSSGAGVVEELPNLRVLSSQMLLETGQLSGQSEDEHAFACGACSVKKATLFFRKPLYIKAK